MATGQSRYDMGWRWCGGCPGWRKPLAKNRCPKCNGKMREHPRNDRGRYVDSVPRVDG